MKRYSLRFFLTVCALSCLGADLSAQANPDLHKTREWIGANGKVFTGRFIGKQNGAYSFYDTRFRKTYIIPPENLSQPDVVFIETGLDPAGAAEMQEKQASFFLPPANLDRSLIPIIDQTLYGNKSSDCVPSTFANFVLWWDQTGYLPIDRRGDFEKKAEWIHDTLGRFFRTRNTAGTSSGKAKEGIARYFERYLKEIATYENIETIGVTPAMMNHYCTGSNCVALEVTPYHGRKKNGSHWVALTKADKDGNISMNTWGVQIDGKLRKLGTATEKDMKKRGFRFQSSYRQNLIDSTIWAIDFTSPLPDWMVTSEVTFQIDPLEYDGMFIIVPSKYKSEEFAGRKPPVFAEFKK